MSSTDFGYYNFEYILDCIKEAWDDFHKNPGKYEGREIDWAMEQTKRIMHIQYAINTSVLLKDESECNTQFKEEFLFAHAKNIEIEQLKNPILFNTEVEAEATGEIAEAIKGDTLVVDPIYDSLEEKTAANIFEEELDAWGIDKKSFTYECVMRIAEVGKAGMPYKELINLIADATFSNPGMVSIAFGRLVKNADFSKTKYNPVLKNIKQLTKEFVVSQLLDFCE